MTALAPRVIRIFLVVYIRCLSFEFIRTVPNVTSLGVAFVKTL